MKSNLLAWNVSPTLELFGGQPSMRSIPDLPVSHSTLSGSDVSANPGFDFFAMPVPQAGSSKIVFTSNRDGNAEIYSMNADGSSLSRLTVNDFNDDHPRWSPDGTKILFQSDRDNPETGNADIYIMNANGSGQTRLTTDAADDSAAVWSPDGTKLVFQSLRNGLYYQVYVMNADGTNQLNKSNGIAADYQPSWSPDGAKIAFASERDHAGRPSVYVMNANGLNQTRLTFTSEPFRDEQPAWSRDATKLAFVSTRDSVIETWQETDDEGGILNRSRVLTNKEVYKMNADGSNQIRLTNTLENDDSPSWSPDGIQIIFRSERERDAYDPAQQLWTMNSDGMNQAIISSNEFGDYSPSWNTSAANQSPVANPGGPYSGSVAQNIPFNGSASFDPDGNISSYSWSFGDGGTGSGAVPTHAYTSTGTYTVTLTVTDNQGAQATANTSITITAAGSEQYLANFNLSALARPPYENESAYWLDILRAAHANGQNSKLLAMRELGKTLFESADYAARNRNNHWYVYDLYKTYLMREPDAPGWAWWKNECNNYGRDNVRRAFDESIEFGNIVATLTPSGSPSSSVSSFASARVDPFNQPGNGLTSRDTDWSVPLLSLPGRAGLDLGLSLSYSSMVWTRSGPYIYFDEDNGWPSPGFRLGFPTIQEKVFDAQAGDNVYLLIAGGRVSLRQVGTSNVYEAADSSYLQLIDNGGSLLVRSTDGTQLSYLKFNNEWHCTQIKDRNGNYITVNYDWLGHITTITDTLARVITFNYDSNANLTSITQSWTVNGVPTTHTWATFGWATKTLSPSFSNVLVVGAPNGSIPVLSQVGLGDGSRHTFEYNATGQVNPIRSYGSDNVERTYTAYDYDFPAGDCPRLVETHVWARNWTGINGVPQEVATVYGDPGDGSHTVTAPDGTLYKEFYGTGWQRGLTIQTEVWSAGVKQKWTSNIWTQDNTGVNYQTNPRVTETNVHDASNHRRTTIDYQTFTLPSGASCSLPSDMREYAGSASTALRRSHIAYRTDAVDDVAYLSRHIIGLIKEQTLFEVSTSGETPMSKVGLQYDEIDSIQGTDAPVGHDNSYDGSFVVGRANLSSVKRYDVENSGQWTVSSVRYNTAGAVVAQVDPLGHQTSISYADSFSANGIDPDAPRSFSTFAFPTTITDADGFSSKVRHHYDHGAKTRVEGPPPLGPEGVQPQGAIQIFAYDDAARIKRVTTANNGAYERFVYGPNYLETWATVNNVADEAYSNTVFDGVGRAVAAAKNHPGSASGYSAVITVYDRMGRAVKQSNPTETTASGVTWPATGDDGYNAQTGEGDWRYSEQTYDWQGRPRVTTNTDGTSREASYSGCGCAGGAVVTLTDEVGRRQKLYSDILGRQWKTEVLNWDASVYSTGVSVFNARDQVKIGNQYAGSAPAEASSTNENVSCPDGTCQKTALTYDGYGRLETKHVPEQDAGTATVFAYKPDDTIESVTDARGASATYGYNNSRHLVNTITYSAPSGITPTSNVSFAYDASGNRTSMTDGSGGITYRYDQLSRLDWEERTFTGLSGAYRLDYDYNLAHQLTSITDPFGAQVGYVHDTAGRLNNVAGAGYANVSTYASNLQYRAWGGLKGLSYGNSFTLAVSYNSRAQGTQFEVAGRNPQYGPSTVMKTQFGYHTDGAMKYAHDVLDERFDRAFSYDHAAMLKEAYSGSESRDYVNGTNSGTQTGPYRQSYQHDPFGNMTQRDNRFWSQTDTLSAGYTNHRRQGFFYDATGNLLADADLVYAYDAVGRNVSIFNGAANNRTISVAHDGDGSVVKRSEIQQNTLTSLTYYIRSSVLEGKVITEVSQSGQKQKGYVFAGGELLASQQNNQVTWRHENPLTGSSGTSGTEGWFSPESEPDPMGVNVGLEDPFSNCCLLPEPNDQIMPALLGGFASGRCRVDGMAIDCGWAMQMLESGSAVQCPNNDCGPRTLRAYDANGNFVGRVLSQPFQAFADGHSGFLPPGARYQGNGYWDLPGTRRPSRSGPPTLRTADPSRSRGSDDGTNEGRSYRLGVTPQRLFNHQQKTLTIEHFTAAQESWIRYEMRFILTPKCDRAYEAEKLKSPSSIISGRGVVIRHAKDLRERSAADLGLDPRTYRDAQTKVNYGQGGTVFGVDGTLQIYLNSYAFVGPNLDGRYLSLAEVLKHEFIHEGIREWPSPWHPFSHDLRGFPGYYRIMEGCK